jgi:transcriptional regulator with XRE-family HTH domain
MFPTQTSLGTLLKEQRRFVGMTLRGAAAKAEIGASTLSRWESGVCEPRNPELINLLRALNLDANGIQNIISSRRPPRWGPFFRAMRLRSGRSLIDIAAQLEVAPSTVSRWETNTARPSPALMERLLDTVEATPFERSMISSTISNRKTQMTQDKTK